VTPDPETLRAQTRAFNAELERLLATLPPVDTVAPEETRRARREGRGAFPAPVFLERARTFQIDGPGGPLSLRIIAPEQGPGAGVFLHIHGGGWTLGEHDMQDLRLQRLASETGLTALSVGYRLAPEHPYPAAPEDCEAAALWLLSDAGRARLGAGPLAIGGDSAGAHLAAVTLLRLRDRHGITGAFSAAVFQYGAFDLSLSPSQRLWGERNLILSSSIIAWFGDNFLPGRDREQRRDPDISPLYARLHSLPPAIFTIGTEDALLDDTLFMEARWRSAGHPTELRVWPEAPHGFISLPIPVADAALAAEHEFLRRTLGLGIAAV
jgi:acetyl esterase/lipase